MADYDYDSIPLERRMTPKEMEKALAIEQRLLKLVAEARLDPLNAPWGDRPDEGLEYEPDGSIMAWERVPNGDIHIVRSSPSPTK